MLNTYTVVSFFIDRVQICNCYLSLSTLASKKISGILLVVCLFFIYVIPTLFQHFNLRNRRPYLSCCSLHCKYTKHMLFLCFIAAINLTFTFHVFLWPSKYQWYSFFFFEISKYFTRYIVCCFFAFNKIISVVFCSLTCNCIRLAYLAGF